MKQTKISLRVLIAVAALTPALFAAEQRRPNIVLIMADDMGFSDLGCYGSEIATPNIDRLASRGIRFTQFYNTARCCPTRAALMTGLYPHQAGVGHMVEDRGIPGYRGFLNDRCVTIAEVLRPAGYRTLMVGKWHVGENRPHWPVDRGFDRHFGLISGGTNYWRLDPWRKMARDDQPYTPPSEGFYITDAFTDQAVEYLKEYGRKPEPFFMYVAYTAPHWPLHAPPETIAKYRGKYMDGWPALRERRHRRMIELGIVKPEWPLSPQEREAREWSRLSQAEKEDRDLKMAVYAAQIDRLDEGVGKILAKLSELELEDNTLVLFLADNGGCAEVIDRGKRGVPPGPADSFLSYGPGWANASNTPFRRFKHWVHEGGISTPLIARWPTVIRKPEITSQPGHVIDIMATCVEVAGAKYPAERKGRQITPLEGKSLVPIFRGQMRQGHEAIYWEHEGNRAVRQGKWKLVSRHAEEWALYDLEADRTELRNLAAENPAKVQELSSLYEAWKKRANVAEWGKLPKAISAPPTGPVKSKSN